MRNSSIYRTAFCLAVCLALFLSQNLLGSTVYMQTNLVSSISGLAAVTDPQLINPWGMSFSPTSPFWLSDQGMNVATLYNGFGAKQGLVVSVGGGPTGQVFNSAGAGNFLLNGAASTFMFATLSGNIDAWNSTAGTTAQVVAATPQSAYTGLAIAGNELFAANFGAARIDVFNSSFANVTPVGSFQDPNLPSGYSPFNVENVNGTLFVAYAQVDPTTHESAAGAGLGYLDAYDTNGNLLRRVVSNGPLDAPWGIAIAPAGFGDFSNTLLVGNFGNGQINSFNPSTGVFLGTLSDAGGNPIVNEGLWAIKTRTGGVGVNTNALYFSAGLNDETAGLFGSLEVLTPEPAAALLLISGMGLIAWRRRKARG